MRTSRNGVALAATIAIALLAMPHTITAQREDKSAEPKLDKAERQEIEALSKLYDQIAEGQAAPTDLKISWQNHFLKATDGKIYVPFTIAFDAATRTTSPVAMYVRVSPRGAATPTATSGDRKEKEEQEKSDALVFPFFGEPRGAENKSQRISRAFALDAGAYDVHVIVRERSQGRRGSTPKAGMLKQELTVPDYWNGELATSSLIVAERVEPLQTPYPPEQQAEHPYALGTSEIMPATDHTFPKSGELGVIFQVYNPALDAEKKPNVVIEYNFHQKVEGGEKYFNKTQPQEWNGQSLGPAFDGSVQPVPGGQSVPLSSFPEGDYRLEIKITDKNSGKTLQKDVSFSVVGT